MQQNNNENLPQPLLDTVREVEAFEQTPLEQRFPENNSYSLIQQYAARYGDDPALEFLLTGQRDEPSRTVTFRQLAADVNRCANLLHSLGMKRQDCVSVMLPILPQSHSIILGSQAAGIVNPVNPLLEAEQIADIIKATEARHIFCLAPSPHTDLWQKLQAILGCNTSITTVIVVHLEGLTDPGAALDLPDHIQVIDYNKALQEQPDDRLISNREFDGRELAAYFHTGGTTGHPKIAQLTHGNMAFMGQLSPHLSAHLGRQTVICGLPLFHIFGVIIQGIAAFGLGYRIILLTPSGFRNPQAIRNLWHHVDRFKVTSFAAVPTILTVLSQIPLDGADISSLTRINSGAAPLSPAFEQAFEKKFRLSVTNGYGMTETTSLIARPPEQQPPGSVGIRLPYSRICIALVEGDRIEKECKPGEPGSILVRGPQVFAGYKSESDNRNAFTQDGWFNTGDLGYLDETGFLYLTGRAKDLIIRSGHNIDPVIIEEPLNAHPDVATAIAVGMPDPYAGELPMVFIVPAGGATPDPEALLAYCQEHIPERAACPKRIELLEAMPVTAVGKIFRPALRQKIIQMTLQEALEKKGITAEVICTHDPHKGLETVVTLTDPSQAAEAEKLLDSYPLAISITGN